jgi:hypothetical protein
LPFSILASDAGAVAAGRVMVMDTGPLAVAVLFFWS